MDRSEIINLLNNPKNMRNVVFWVGAGIDADAPTSLPLGEELTNFVLKQTVDYAEDFINANPRLETIFNCIRLLEENIVSKTVDNPFLMGMQSFWYVQPNNNHFFLASKIKEGASVVTCNFDNCISMAYKTLGYGELRLIDEGNGYYIMEDIVDKNAGKLYYYHGIANDIKTLGVTLSQLENGLHKNFSKQIVNWLDEKRLFCFSGYSGSDDLDVNVFFRTVEKRSGTKAIFLKYSKKTATPTYSLDGIRDSKIRLILNAFDEGVYYETENDKVWQMEKFRKPTDELSAMTWKESYMNALSDKYAYYSEEQKQALAVQLCDKLGVYSPKSLPKNWDTYSKITSVSKWYILFYAYDLGKTLDDPSLMELFNIKEPSDLMKSDYLSSEGKLYEAAIVLGSLNDINKRLNQAIDENLTIDWNISSGLNRWCTYIVDVYMNNEFDCPSVSFEEMRKELIELYILFIKNDDNKLDIEQLYTANRGIALLRQIACPSLKNIEDIEKVKEMYSSISSQSGVVGTMISLAICYLCFFVKTKQIDYYCKCKRTISEALSECTDKAYYKSKLLNVLGLLDKYSSK